MRTEISKSKFLFWVWFLIIIGLILVTVFYTLFTYSNFHSPQMEYLAWYGLGMLVTGFGVGWATSRQIKIKGYEN